jgi:hypothetical protein
VKFEAEKMKAFKTRVDNLLIELTKLSKVLGTQIECMSLAVQTSQVGYEGVDDIEARMRRRCGCGNWRRRTSSWRSRSTA